VKLIANPTIWISNPKGHVSSFVSWQIQSESEHDLPSKQTLHQIFEVVFGETDLVQTDYGSLNQTLALLAIKLQAKNTDDLFKWMITENRVHRTEEFTYPSLDDHLARAVGPMALNLFNRLRLELSNPENEVSTDVKTKIGQILGAFHFRASSVAPSDDALRFLIKARERGLSVRRHSNLPSYQLGIGAMHAVVSKGFTNLTSQIATNLSTHKPLAVSVLSNSGLPVPSHFVAKSLSAATQAAERIGFPVVVKPTSTDKGVGVFIGVNTNDELAVTFEEASKYGPVLVEQYIKGFDHRFHVVNGNCVYVTQRVPPFVVGNGVDSIEVLLQKSIAQRSQNPVYLVYPSASLTDPEVARQLTKHGFTATTVLPRGETFYLRYNSNVSTGGSFEIVTDRAHPDNIALAERAARVIGLDNAGIDFITTDVSKSWKESGGRICEINPDPGTADYNSFDKQLDYLFPDSSNGRAPLILIINSPEATDSLSVEIENQFLAQGLSWGAIREKTLKVQTVFGSFEGRKTSLKESIHGLVSDTAVTAAFVEVKMEDLTEGLEIDYFSLIFTSGLSEDELREVHIFAESRCNQSQIIENPSKELLISKVQAILSAF
jgi:D-alanine-D-alanine ligase-like ATP-grasp enzyme